MTQAVPLSFSQLKVFKRCPYRFNLEYNQGIQRNTKGLRLAEGDFIHRLLAHLHTPYDGPPWRSVWESIKDEYADAAFFEEDAEEVVGLSDRVLNIVGRYEQQVAPIFAEVVAFEHEFQVDLYGVLVVIKPDLLVRINGQLWLVDHKTVRDFPEAIEEELRYDDQISLYLWGLRSLGFDVIGAYHNCIRTRLPRFPGFTQKGLLSRAACVTDKETVIEGFRASTSENALDLENYLATMKMSEFFKQVPTFRSDRVLDQLALDYRRTYGMMEEASRKGPWARFMQRDCTRCPVRELCLGDLHGADTEAIMHTTFTTREGRRQAREIPAELMEEVGG